MISIEEFNAVNASSIPGTIAILLRLDLRGLTVEEQAVYIYEEMEQYPCPPCEFEVVVATMEGGKNGPVYAILNHKPNRETIIYSPGGIREWLKEMPHNETEE